jgi:hypothetical protein
MERPVAPTDIWVAFSFAGEQRDFVESIAVALEERLGTGRVFYDRWYEAWANGDRALHRLKSIYHNEAAINVVCLSEDYDVKPWTIEERNSIISRRMHFTAKWPTEQYHQELLLRVGKGEIADFTAIFSDVSNRTVDAIVRLIVDKLALAREQFSGKCLVSPRADDIAALPSTPAALPPVNTILSGDAIERLRRGCAYLRLELSYHSSTRLQVDLSCKLSGSALLNERAMILSAGDAQDIVDRIRSNPRFREALAKFSGVAKPTRIQIAFDRTVVALLDLAWEQARWGGSGREVASEYLFTRHVLQHHAEPGSFAIRSKNKIDIVERFYIGEPQHHDDTEHWSQALGVGAASRASVNDLFLDFDEAELLTLAVPMQADLSLAAGRDGSDDFLALRFEEIERRLESLLARKHGPSLIVLAPRETLTNDINAVAAKRLAILGVPAVLAVLQANEARAVTTAAWRELHAHLMDELTRHGLIDVAVTNSRALADARGFTMVLYLRAKSARLWYEPGFTTAAGVDVSERDVWAAFQSSGFGPPASDTAAPASATGDQAGADTVRADATNPSVDAALAEGAPALAPISLAVLIGTAFDEELSLSRRDLATAMAKRSGFALARRDAEDLGVVADYVEIKGAKDDSRPHVTLFMDEVKRHLLSLRPDLRSYAAKPPEELIAAISKSRNDASSNPYQRLARLKAHTFITSYYHDLLERALDNLEREHAVAQFNAPKIAMPAKSDAADVGLYATVERPLVYHAFGRFGYPESILLSRMDHLRFFESFCLRRNPVVDLVRTMLGQSALIFLGFKPTSEHLRMLLHIYQSIEGNQLGNKQPRVAVQVDPEDDHTADPDGARDYYQGMLAKLGNHVYIFWGPPDEFLKRMEENCGALFVPAAMASQSSRESS